MLEPARPHCLRVNGSVARGGHTIKQQIHGNESEMPRSGAGKLRKPAPEAPNQAPQGGEQ